MVAAGCTVSVPEALPLIASVLTPARPATSLMVSALFFTSLPVVESKRVMALAVAEDGPFTPPAGAHSRVPLASDAFRYVPCAPTVPGMVNG